MLNYAIRFIATVAVQTAVDTAVRILVSAAIYKVASYFMREDEIVETHESTNSEED